MVEKLDSCGKTMMKTGRRRRFVCVWVGGGGRRSASVADWRALVCRRRDGGFIADCAPPHCAGRPLEARH